MIGLADVERAFVHVDYEDEHDVHEEHKPLYEKKSEGKNLKDILSAGKKKIGDLLPGGRPASS